MHLLLWLQYAEVQAALVITLGAIIVTALLEFDKCSLRYALLHFATVFILTRVTATKLAFFPAWYDDINLEGKVILVTGASRGIGNEIAWRLLAYKPKRLILGIRNASKRDVTDHLVTAASRACSKAVSKDIVKVIDLDLSSMDSVVSFAKEVRADNQHLDVLILNAGTVEGANILTLDKFNQLTAVNVLGHLLLYEKLKDLLLAPRPEARCDLCANCCRLRRLQRPVVVTLTSCTHMLASPTRLPAPFVAYADSKLACLYIAQQIAAHEKGIDAYAVHPGFVATHLSAATAAQAGVASVLNLLASKVIGKSAADAAQSVIYCVLSGQAKSGEMYHHGRLTQPSADGCDVAKREHTYGEIKGQLKHWL